MKRVITVMGAVVAMLVACSALAATGQIDKTAITKAFQKAFPGYQITDVQPTPMAGIAVVELNGSSTVYASNDGRFVFTGDLIQLGEQGPVNLSEQRLQAARQASLAKVSKADMITYPARGQQKAQIYAFTDTSCPYCRKLHSHMADYNKAGITVHYLAFPRGGLTSQAAEDMRHIWCSSNPEKAFTEANLHDRVSEAKLGDCAKAVDSQYQLGMRLGVRGTPAIYTADGAQIGGYLTPAQMKQRLGL